MDSGIAEQISENRQNTCHSVVLLVDDQAMVAEAIRRMLADEENMEFHYCADPSQALNMAIEVQATVILQDLVMPDVDGMTLMRFYKNHQQTKNIPVIVLSSKDDAKVKSEAFASGANDYLVKLPDPIELVARICAHSKHYRTQLERDAAYQILQGMQQQLEETNKQLEDRNRELQRLSTQDGLTGIANRRSFDDFIDKAWRLVTRKDSEVPMSLIMIDIDHFKLYNDGYGHQQGDDCLKQVAKALEACVHRATDLVARYGGEEFVVILGDTPLDGAVKVAETMRQCIEQLAIPHAYSKVCEQVTLSIGIASSIPSSNNTPQQLIEAADQALYNAKNAGRNQIKKCEK